MLTGMSDIRPKADIVPAEMAGLSHESKVGLAPADANAPSLVSNAPKRSASQLNPLAFL
jgi:hypothetical protein